MRYLYLALFDSRKTNLLEHNVLVDCGCFLLVIIPLYVIALRFWTAPSYLNYKNKLNSFVAPLAIPVIFLATHWDIIFLAIQVLWMNFYVFWYHIDPPQNIYQTTNHRIKQRKVAEKLQSQKYKREKLY